MAKRRGVGAGASLDVGGGRCVWVAERRTDERAAEDGAARQLVCPRRVAVEGLDPQLGPRDGVVVVLHAKVGDGGDRPAGQAAALRSGGRVRCERRHLCGLSTQAHCDAHDCRGPAAPSWSERRRDVYKWQPPSLCVVEARQAKRLRRSTQ
eukprot:scaffold66611_cov65-Phaeocystis_antarctica.AAC.14